MLSHPFRISSRLEVCNILPLHARRHASSHAAKRRKPEIVVPPQYGVLTPTAHGAPPPSAIVPTSHGVFLFDQWDEIVPSEPRVAPPASSSPPTPPSDLLSTEHGILPPSSLPKWFEDVHTLPAHINRHSNLYHKALINRLSCVTQLSSVPDMRVAYDRLVTVYRAEQLPSSIGDLTGRLVETLLNTMEALEWLGPGEAADLNACLRADLHGIWRPYLHNYVPSHTIRRVLRNNIERICKFGSVELTVDLLESAASRERGSGRLRLCQDYYLWTNTMAYLVSTLHPSAEQITSILQRMAACGVRGRPSVFKTALGALLDMDPPPSSHITQCMAIFDRHHIGRGRIFKAIQVSWQLRDKSLRPNEHLLRWAVERAEWEPIFCENAPTTRADFSYIVNAAALHQSTCGHNREAWVNLDRLRVHGQIPDSFILATILNYPSEVLDGATELDMLDHMASAAPSSATVMWAGIWFRLQQARVPVDERLRRATLVFQAATRHATQPEDKLSLAWPIICTYLSPISSHDTFLRRANVKRAAALYESVYVNALPDGKPMQGYGRKKKPSYLETLMFDSLLSGLLRTQQLTEAKRLCIHGHQHGLSLLGVRSHRLIETCVKMAMNEEEAISTVSALLLVGEMAVLSPIARALSDKIFPTAPHVASPSFLMELHKERENSTRPTMPGYFEAFQELYSYERLLDRYQKFLSADLGLKPRDVQLCQDDHTFNAICNYIRQIHARMLTLAVNGFATRVAWLNLMNSYITIHEFSEAWNVFNGMLEMDGLDSEDWSKVASVVLDLCAYSGHCESADVIWQRLRDKCPKLHDRAWASYLQCFCRTGPQQRQKALDILCFTMGERGDPIAHIPPATADLAITFLDHPDGTSHERVGYLKQIKTHLPNVYKQLKELLKPYQNQTEEYKMVEAFTASTFPLHIGDLSWDSGQQIRDISEDSVL